MLEATEKRGHDRNQLLSQRSKYNIYRHIQALILFTRCIFHKERASEVYTSEGEWGDYDIPRCLVGSLYKSTAKSAMMKNMPH